MRILSTNNTIRVLSHKSMEKIICSDLYLIQRFTSMKLELLNFLNSEADVSTNPNGPFLQSTLGCLVGHASDLSPKHNLVSIPWAVSELMPPQYKYLLPATLPRQLSCLSPILKLKPFTHYLEFPTNRTSISSAHNHPRWPHMRVGWIGLSNWFDSNTKTHANRWWMDLTEWKEQE
jgi:hypothetical protein